MSNIKERERGGGKNDRQKKKKSLQNPNSLFRFKGQSIQPLY